LRQPQNTPPYGEAAVSLPDHLAQGQQKRELFLTISVDLLQVRNKMTAWHPVARPFHKIHINQKDITLAPIP